MQGKHFEFRLQSLSVWQKATNKNSLHADAEVYACETDSSKLHLNLSVARTVLIELKRILKFNAWYLHILVQLGRSISLVLGPSDWKNLWEMRSILGMMTFPLQSCKQIYNQEASEALPGAMPAAHPKYGRYYDGPPQHLIVHRTRQHWCKKSTSV